MPLTNPTSKSALFRFRNIHLTIIVTLFAFVAVLCWSAPAALAHSQDAVFLALKRPDEKELEMAFRQSVAYAYKMGADPDIQFVTEQPNLRKLTENGKVFIYGHAVAGHLESKDDDTPIRSLAAALSDPQRGLSPTFKGEIIFFSCNAGTAPVVDKSPLKKLKLELAAHGLVEKYVDFISTGLVRTTRFSSAELALIETTLIDKKAFSHDKNENKIRVDELMNYLKQLRSSQQGDKVTITREPAKAIIDKTRDALRARGMTGIKVKGALGKTIIRDEIPSLEVLEDGITPEFFNDLSNAIYKFYGQSELDSEEQQIVSKLKLDPRMRGKFSHESIWENFQGAKKYQNLDISPRNYELVARASLYIVEELTSHWAAVNNTMVNLDLSTVDYPFLQNKPKRLFKSPDEAFREVVT